MVTRVKGGIIDDQMLKGKLRFFKIEAATAEAFKYTVGTDTVGDGTGNPEVIIPNTTSIINDHVSEDVTYVEKIGIKQPVPKSVAEIVIRLILEKCTISMIRIISEEEIHIAVENTDFGWDESPEGPFDFDTGLKVYQAGEVDAVDNIMAEIAKLGTVTGIPATDDIGKTYVFDTTGDGTGTSTITVTEAAFELA